MKNHILTLAAILISSTVFAQNAAMEPLLWEKKVTYESKEAYEARLEKSKLWSQKLYEVMRDPKEKVKLHKMIPADADFYCPNYAKLNENQRINFWGQLISAISFKESSGFTPKPERKWKYWNPLNRFEEPKEDFPNGDSVTGSKSVYSEGLMQLSYQDGRNYKKFFDCEFDWSKDQHYKSEDSRKTILAPYRNLRCGLLILNHRVVINEKITTPGVYWSVLRPRMIEKRVAKKDSKGKIVKVNGKPLMITVKVPNRYSQTIWIAKQTQSLSFCGKSSLVQNTKIKE
jgi:hypothetical protein